MDDEYKRIINLVTEYGWGIKVRRLSFSKGCYFRVDGFCSDRAMFEGVNERGYIDYWYGGEEDWKLFPEPDKVDVLAYITPGGYLTWATPDIDYKESGWRRVPSLDKLGVEVEP